MFRAMSQWLDRRGGIHPFNEDWDRFVNYAIDHGLIELQGDYVVLLAGVHVWVGNFPYGYGSPQTGAQMLPAQSTRKKLNQAILAARLAKHRLTVTA